MRYWIFSVTNQKEKGKNIQGREILQTRLKDGFWGLGERTPNLRKLQAGDKVVFYEAIPTKSFVASATLKSNSFELTPEEMSKFSHGRDVFTTKLGIYLDEVHFFDKPILVEGLVEILSFIENKEYWYSYFQGGAREINDQDYQTILGARPVSLVEQIKETEDLQSQSQFALESHLEEFMYKNWGKINFGEKLELYSDEERDGHQFPADIWSIDFLCLDKNRDFVVIELKRGKTSDATVGQVLRYIGWVKKNLASPDQKVRGIIITHEKDVALQYAVSTLQYVNVMTYQVDFRLKIESR